MKQNKTKQQQKKLKIWTLVNLIRDKNDEKMFYSLSQDSGNMTYTVLILYMGNMDFSIKKKVFVVVFFFPFDLKTLLHWSKYTDRIICAIRWNQPILLDLENACKRI